MAVKILRQEYNLNTTQKEGEHAKLHKMDKVQTGANHGFWHYEVLHHHVVLYKSIIHYSLMHSLSKVKERHCDPAQCLHVAGFLLALVICPSRGW